MKTKLFTLLLAIVASIGTMFASDTQVDGIWYDFDSSSKTASVTFRGSYYSSYSNEYTNSVVIPASVVYNFMIYSVTSIGEYAFYNCSGLTSVAIPNSVTSIGDRAFWGCSGLTSVTIPNSVTSIGDFAFYYCSGLTSVTIPNSVTSIGEWAFYYCSGLTSVTIPNSVTSIGDRAFLGCSGLTSITCEAITPPTLGDIVFSSVNKSIPLYVPAESVALYKAANQWKDFTNILPIEETPGTCITASGTCGAQGDNLTWELSCDSILTISGTGEMANYSNVSSVPWYSYHSSIQYVVIGNNVTSIGDRAFRDCTSLASVTIPNSVTSIGESAFQNCGAITEVTIGSGLIALGKSVFNKCTAIELVHWNAINYRQQKPNQDSNCFPFYSSKDNISTFVFGDSVTYIPAYLLKDFSRLESIVIPAGVTEIGEYAFAACTGLTSVTIPGSVTSIGYSTFAGCSGLTSIIVESGNMVYDSRNNCSAIIETATNTLITGCQSTIIPNSVTSIGNYAFSGCSGLTSVTIPNSVTSIGNGAFSVCTGLTSVTIPNSVTSIGESTFSVCTGLTSVTIPNSVTSIGDNAFYNCTGLTSVTIPNSVTSIGNSAFYRCIGLTSVTIPGSVTSIGGYAFYKCTGLTSVTIPNSVTSIGESTFSHCSSLTSITIPNSVTSIGNYAFYNCTGLTSVTIPNSVTSIGEYAFAACTGLTSITCEAITPPTTLGSGVFSSVDKSIPLYVPAESVEAYQAADQWKDFTNILPISSVVIPQYTVSLFANNPSYGSVIGGGSFPQDTTITIAAIPNEGYRFVQWSDSVKTNPRQIVVTQDTSLTALFELSTLGQCGETAYWQYNENKLYIYGEGDMYDYTAASTPWQPFKADIQSIKITSTITSVGAYAFAGLSNRKFKEIFLPQGLLSIGKHAFDGDAYLETIDFGANVELIGDSAFNGCSRVASMTCLAPSTPDVGADALTSISSYAELNVLASAIRKYQVDPNWSRFFIQEIGTNTTTVTNDDVTVDPQDNAATVTWPTNDNAATYTLQITKDGVVFCTLIFNANGQLTGIAFAPSRDGQAHAPAALMTASGMQFTVTGLDSGTHYALTLQAKDSQENVLASYSSEFTTTGEGVTTGLDNTPFLSGEGRGEASKLLHNGQIYIIRGDKTYTLQGQEVK